MINGRVREVQVSEHPVIQAGIGTLRCVVEKIEHLEVWLDLEPLFDRYRSRNADISSEPTLEWPRVVLRHESDRFDECSQIPELSLVKETSLDETLSMRSQGSGY